MRITVDASVFVAAADLEEVEHQNAKRFLASLAMARHQALCPALVLPEVAASIARITRDEGLGQVAVLRVLSVPRLRLVPLTEVVARKAAHLAGRHFLRGADSVYVALASDSRSPLVTLDAEMRERGAAAVKTLTPAEWLEAFAEA